MAEVVVYGSRISPFVEKVVRALQLKKIDYDLVEPRSPLDLRRWNRQTGKIPVVDLNGERLYDSTLILRRIDELFREPRLVAEDPWTAAVQRQLEDWSDESLYWYVMALRWSKKHARASVDQITGNAPALFRPIARAILTRQIGSTTDLAIYGMLACGTSGPTPEINRLVGERPALVDWMNRVEQATAS
jgi:glutathione S-transferase